MSKARFASWVAVEGALALFLLAPQLVQARDVQVFGPIGPIAIGDSATFTVADQQFGDQCDANLGYCAADFSVFYDGNVLKYVGTDYVGPVLLDPSFDLFTAPGAGDADPAGALNVQLVLTSALPSGAGNIFSVTFKAIAASGAGGTLFSVSPLANAPSYVFQTAVASVSVVPEPSTAWMMSIALIAGLIALRRQR